MSKFKDFNLWQFIETKWLTLSLGTVGIMIGIYAARISGETAMSASIAIGILGAFLGDLIMIATRMSSEGGIIMYLSLLIFGPLIVAYGIALWDWVRGKD